MQFDVSKLDILIQKQNYNKSVVGEDGITHTIDTSKQYTLYSLSIHKNYFDMDNSDDVIQQIIKDLNQLSASLETLLNKEKEDIQER